MTEGMYVLRALRVAQTSRVRSSQGKPGTCRTVQQNAGNCWQTKESGKRKARQHRKGRMSQTQQQEHCQASQLSSEMENHQENKHECHQENPRKERAQTQHILEHILERVNPQAHCHTFAACCTSHCPPAIPVRNSTNNPSFNGSHAPLPLPTASPDTNATCTSYSGGPRGFWGGMPTYSTCDTWNSSPEVCPRTHSTVLCSVKAS